MIFVTVGTQLPFTRLIDAMDEIAGRLDEEIIAQTGPGEGNWSNLDCRKNLEPEEFGKLFSAARVIVAHAGIGTILSARSRRKPLILLPRRFSFGEHRNDHQMATAGQVKSLPGIYIAENVENLEPLIRRADLEPASEAESPARTALISRLKEIIG